MIAAQVSHSLMVGSFRQPCSQFFLSPVCRYTEDRQKNAAWLCPKPNVYETVPIKNVYPNARQYSQFYSEPGK